MSVDANALERETLERKDRDELQKIAGALGGKVTSRTRKADIIDMILELTGVTSSGDTDAPAETDDTGEKTERADNAENADNGKGKGKGEGKGSERRVVRRQPLGVGQAEPAIGCRSEAG